MLRMCSTNEPHLSLQSLCLPGHFSLSSGRMITQWRMAALKSPIPHFLPGGRWPGLLPGLGKAEKLALNISTNISLLLCRWHCFPFLATHVVYFEIWVWITVGSGSFIGDLSFNIRHLYLSLGPKLILSFFFSLGPWLGFYILRIFDINLILMRCPWYSIFKLQA